MEELRSLIQRTCSGDLEAFGRIVRRFQDMAYGYAYSILNDFHLAEDVAQEAFLEAYRQLPKLHNPDAFPGWFRRIVFKYCDRMTRRRQVHTVNLDEAKGMHSEDAVPSKILEECEMQDKVLEAIRALPENQRIATTLFYINGYSQKEISEFLEVAVTTVKKRLHDSREKLKERMIGMVENTLKSNAPDERFSQGVIAELLRRPRPLEIKGHPICAILALIRSAFPDYEYVEGEEMIDKSAAVIFQAAGEPEDVYCVDESRILRTQTTDTIMQATAGRESPVRLLTAGRVFRPDKEDSSHLKVFHQMDLLSIKTGADLPGMKAAIRKALEAIFGQVELRWRGTHFPGFEHCLETDIRKGEKWLEVAGCGMLTAKMLEKCGHDPQSVKGFAFGMGLERIAVLKYGLDDVRKLWQPPYVPKTPDQ